MTSGGASALDDVRSEHGLTLGELTRELSGGATLKGDPGVRVFGVHHDSRLVREGDLFVARKGASSDGAAFIADAIGKGAKAVLVSRGASIPSGVAAIEVDDTRDALALSAAAVYEHPSFGLDVVGVTGTNGKTTTTHLIAAAIDAAVGAARCGLIGTVGYKYGSLSAGASLTTPEADELARAMLAMKRLGASHVAMEVSSIALSLGRARAVRFAVGAFTNLTQDHLDFHGTMEAYGEAKAKLFLEHTPGTAVVCVDSEFGRSLADRTRARVVRTSSRTSGTADVMPTALSLSASGIQATFATPSGPVSLRSPLVGAHNVENLSVALGTLVALGLDVQAAGAALANEKGAPGRLERCDGPDDQVAVFVDYAHTPDALARVLDALRAVCTGRLWCVFGCGGDRDAKKRGPMGEAVATRASVAVITSDNPRTEDPALIARPIEEAVAAKMRKLGEGELEGAHGYVVELDRAKAIALAVGHASAGDVVVIAGKGHEPYQIVGTVKRPFDDREQAARALAARRSAR